MHGMNGYFSYFRILAILCLLMAGMGGQTVLAQEGRDGLTLGASEATLYFTARPAKDGATLSLVIAHGKVPAVTTPEAKAVVRKAMEAALGEPISDVYYGPTTNQDSDDEDEDAPPLRTDK